MSKSVAYDPVVALGDSRRFFKLEMWTDDNIDIVGQFENLQHESNLADFRNVLSGHGVVDEGIMDVIRAVSLAYKEYHNDGYAINYKKDGRVQTIIMRVCARKADAEVDAAPSEGKKVKPTWSLKTEEVENGRVKDWYNNKSLCITPFGRETDALQHAKDLLEKFTNQGKECEIVQGGLAVGQRISRAGVRHKERGLLKWLTLVRLEEKYY